MLSLEIEVFLYTHPDILDAQVIGVPNDRYGEELMVWLPRRECYGWPPHLRSGNNR